MIGSLIVLGSTGSIGTQTLSVCKGLGIRPTVLTAHKNHALLAEQARAFLPQMVVIADESGYKALKTALADTGVKVQAGAGALLEAGAHPSSDTVLNALVGMSGIAPTMAALTAGKRLLLANKESLVAAGALVTKTVREKNLTLLPVDSEHSAIFQCLQGNTNNRIKRLLLTASGGPFFGKDRDALAGVTVKEALNHPNWSMGRKITIDSATLMNKGLELIEAVWLFSVSPSQIQVQVHRQSIVHSGVEFMDGALIAQLGSPDMTLPIRYAITYPERRESVAPPLDLLSVGTLTFQLPDEETFGCLRLARAAIAKGGLAPTALNAANEGAVELFLAGRIGFLEIEARVKQVLEQEWGDYQTLEQVLAASREAYGLAKSL